MRTVLGVLQGAGIEKQYNDILQGVDGQRRVVVDNMGRVRESETTDMREAKPGKNLQLSLDLDLQVVAELAMENKMVTVDAAAMAKEVAATGRVALYGIYFDTNKTDIKPESAPAIDEIAKFLKQDAKAIVYVVGHTDNVGGYEQNMGLSQRRAEAVVKELTTKHGIPATRLKAAGSGPLAPMAPNETEEGRAKNRRVELVKQ